LLIDQGEQVPEEQLVVVVVVEAEPDTENRLRVFAPSAGSVAVTVTDAPTSRRFVVPPLHVTEAG